MAKVVYAIMGGGYLDGQDVQSDELIALFFDASEAYEFAYDRDLLVEEVIWKEEIV